MVYILNQLPQNISGTSISNNNMYYCTNSCVELGNKSSFKYNLSKNYKSMISENVDISQTYSFSIEDHEGNEIPMSAIADTVGNIIFFYMDIQRGYLSVKITYPTGVTPNSGDRFANIGMNVFAVFQNQPKNFYYCNLQNSKVFTQITNVYNTVDGTSSGTTRKGGQIGILFGHTLVSMGGDTGYISFFYCDTSTPTPTLTYKNNYSNKYWAPWGCGVCKVIDSITIFGAGATYNSDHFCNVIYTCSEDSSHSVNVTCYVSYINDKDGNIIDDGGVKSHPTVGDFSLYNKKLQALLLGTITGVSATEVYGINNTFVKYNFECFPIQFATSMTHNKFCYYQNRTIHYVTINDDFTISTLTANITDNSVCMKLPGLPGFYYDQDKTDTNENVYAWIGYMPYYQYYLPRGSIVNEKVIEEYGSTGVPSRTKIKIQHSSNNFTKLVHSDLGNGKNYFY